MEGRKDRQDDEALRLAVRDALAGAGGRSAGAKRAKMKAQLRQRRRRLTPWTTALRVLRRVTLP